MAGNDEPFGYVLEALEAVYRSVELDVDENRNDNESKYCGMLWNAFFYKIGPTRCSQPDANR